MKTFTREKKIYCGEKYLEVDIYTYTKNQEEVSRRGKRSKRKKESEPKQKNLNDKNARRYLTQLANTNFGEGDLHVAVTYKDKFLPETIEAAEKEISNYLRRISYRRKKDGLDSLKYILVTEYSVEKDGEKPVRIHHHIFMNGGLSREVIEDLWSKRKQKGQKKGESIGYINADRLQPDENGTAALCRYLTKYKNRKKRWSSSHNLKKPWSRTNDHKYSRREVEKICKEIPSRSYWEKKYPGWTLTNSDYGFKAEYNDITGWSVYLKMRRLE
ncbi:hypothetical protein [Clostridium magnum]|uniref:Replication initiation protein n=1 Tax=Clostridium magnum DSM 2767 TaxID=1121326 RepID=A0A161Y5L7_9CLOT|nr:hypothetical protein [Clostridium magnum]KZL93529.1 hypothetical protein CLMAG_05750 [Clostridium magnum DSM 2767]SHI62018.1 hypothetical protein SAMN02745944_04601 [Clostridium magnum DSM 2767]